ncbi:MAG TPA: molybdate ABC transporter substrate-binding protein [Candidatus Corynebacterium gallistercoris]|uniref:Molybdate ABC transporter substrate-binding protein n=1 Tax=Candidatus Corynebacterium gallistercoris TaxID=2838530 RepID=A0A9D1RYQ1_9CORY|nr:molybdate ABC transporter substrate-binding protein [Candidatus Corynebacterium gallistercoris]
MVNFFGSDATASRPRPALFVAFAAALLAVVFLAACSSNDSSETPTTTPPAGEEYGEVQVFAAASMKPVSDELKKAFEESHPGASLVFNFAGSSDLVRQIEQGAPAEVFISANRKNMDKALESPDFAGAEPQVIATNELVLGIPDGNPGSISTLESIAGKRVAICAPEVPCGTIAHQVLEAHNLTLDNPTEEANVSGVSTKVATGEVDAGFMYSTDAVALADQGVTGVTIDGVEPNSYPVALTVSGQENATAVAFKEWLAGEEAQKILADYGFPPAS